MNICILCTQYRFRDHIFNINSLASALYPFYCFKGQGNTFTLKQLLLFSYFSSKFKASVLWIKMTQQKVTIFISHWLRRTQTAHILLSKTIKVVSVMQLFKTFLMEDACFQSLLNFLKLSI